MEKSGLIYHTHTELLSHAPEQQEKYMWCCKSQSPARQFFCLLLELLLFSTAALWATNLYTVESTQMVTMVTYYFLCLLFHGIRSSPDRPRTFRCRLNALQFQLLPHLWILSSDHVLPPQTTMGDWKLGEGFQSSGTCDTNLTSPQIVTQCLWLITPQSVSNVIIIGLTSRGWRVVEWNL